MKFLLMMNCPRNGYERFAEIPPEILKAHMDFMHAFARKLSAAGELVAAHGLAAPTEAKLVRMGKDGKPATDGVFAESKEYLAGFWIIDVDSTQVAFERAAEASTAPLPPNIVLEIEVREVMSVSQDGDCPA
jgi:hypothetical protein